MNIQERQFIETKVMSHKKSSTVAYVLWFFLGVFGGHRFYLGKIGSGFGMLALNLLTSWFTFGIPIVIWWIVDAFLIKNMLKEDEAKIRREAMAEVELSKAHSASSHVQEKSSTPVVSIEDKNKHVG